MDLKKSHCDFFLIFLQSTHQVDLKNIVECYKDFFAYFNDLETYSVENMKALEDCGYI